MSCGSLLLSLESNGAYLTNYWIVLLGSLIPTPIQKNNSNIPKDLGVGGEYYFSPLKGGLVIGDNGRNECWCYAGVFEHSVPSRQHYLGRFLESLGGGA